MVRSKKQGNTENQNPKKQLVKAQKATDKTNHLLRNTLDKND